MYHKAKCRARLVTRHTNSGDVIHVRSAQHNHKPMYTAEGLEIAQNQNSLTHWPLGCSKAATDTQQLELSHDINSFRCLPQLRHLQQQYQQLKLPLFPQPIVSLPTRQLKN
ncbi:uncharacterized protein LOC101456836 [Ceratitis capitata]|nr:uncharacterized protein LOC101456836 [Ceratitis capitata]